jgi:hypothetical protein
MEVFKERFFIEMATGLTKNNKALERASSSRRGGYDEYVLRLLDPLRDRVSEVPLATYQIQQWLCQEC